jgi:hypothetical protein
MKTMKLGDIIKRVKEDEVADKLKFGWVYIPKSEWKKNVRNVKTVDVVKTDENDVITDKPKRSKKQKIK